MSKAVLDPPKPVESLVSPTPNSLRSGLPAPFTSKAQHPANSPPRKNTDSTTTSYQLSDGHGEKEGLRETSQLSRGVSSEHTQAKSNGAPDEKCLKQDIQSIMNQFTDNTKTHSERVNSPVNNSPVFDTGESFRRPSSSSSLESIDGSGLRSSYYRPKKLDLDVPVDSPRFHQSPQPQSPKGSNLVDETSFSLGMRHAALAPKNSQPQSSPKSLQKPLPPEPDPEPDLPFDFHRFLEQLRHRTADPVARFLRSFLIEFGKKQWMVHEQIKIISDFLAFIANKMMQCEVWRGVSNAEFDNAKEGMEKLVMNRLYSQTFSPAIPPPPSFADTKNKKKNTEKESRKGQHQEDIERDEILSQKVRIYSWIQEKHLDIPPTHENGRRFLALAQQELLKITSYRAPRDKIICVLNCCKVIFGLLRTSKASDTSADSFMPLLIYVVLRTNPAHLVSNIQYILRFRNQDKLGGEVGYYLSSLMGAIQFIENLDRSSLTVSDTDFEKNVEAAVSAIAEGHEEVLLPPTQHILSEKYDSNEPETFSRSSSKAQPLSSDKGSSPRDNSSDESTAVGGLFRTIQKPLSSIGRIFSEESLDSNDGKLHQSEMHVQPVQSARLSPAVFQPPQDGHSDHSEENPEELHIEHDKPLTEPPRHLNNDAGLHQASAERTEAQLLSAEHDSKVETLARMFPDLDREIIDDVLRVENGRIGQAVDACLILNP